MSYHTHHYRQCTPRDIWCLSWQWWYKGRTIKMFICYRSFHSSKQAYTRVLVFKESTFQPMQLVNDIVTLFCKALRVTRACSVFSDDVAFLKSHFSVVIFHHHARTQKVLSKGVQLRQRCLYEGREDPKKH